MLNLVFTPKKLIWHAEISFLAYYNSFFLVKSFWGGTIKFREGHYAGRKYAVIDSKSFFEND